MYYVDVDKNEVYLNCNCLKQLLFSFIHFFNCASVSKALLCFIYIHQQNRESECLHCLHHSSLMIRDLFRSLKFFYALFGFFWRRSHVKVKVDIKVYKSHESNLVWFFLLVKIGGDLFRFNYESNLFHNFMLNFA